MKIVFMGTPDFAATVLEGLFSTEHEIGYVVTQPDKAKNRGKKIQFTPVKDKALQHGVPVLQPEKIRGNSDFLETMKEYNPDIIVVVAFGQILPKSILELPKYGCINVHASLLPKLRGAAPIQRAIIDGEEKTGVTIMQMADGIDTGDMILKESVDIGHMNYSQLHDVLADIGTNLLIKTLDLIDEGQATRTPQDETLSTYAKMIFKQEGQIDFSKSPVEVERLIRGFDPWPGAFCQYGDIVIKLWKAEPLDDICSEPAGTIMYVGEEGIKISCGGKILLATEIQVPGKKRVAVKDYIRGNDIIKGSILK